MFQTTTVTTGSGMMPGFGVGDFLFTGVLFVLLVCLIPFWRIFRKAGFPPALSLLMPIPVINLVLLYILAFSDWPALRKKHKPEDLI